MHMAAIRQMLWEALKQAAAKCSSYLDCLFVLYILCYCSLFQKTFFFLPVQIMSKSLAWNAITQFIHFTALQGFCLHRKKGKSVWEFKLAPFYGTGMVRLI